MEVFSLVVEENEGAHHERLRLNRVKSFLDLRRKVNIILPIVLSVLMPGLSFSTYGNTVVPDDSNYYPVWALSSFILYNIWHLIWNLWDIREKYGSWQYWGKLLLFTALSFGAIQFLILTNFQDFNSYSNTRTLLGIGLFAVIQYTLRTQGNIARLRLEKEQIQTENYKARLTALHAKIDPHFLFNSLNTLRSMVRQSHSNSEEFILSLSDFYRQTLKYNESTELPLSEELKVLESYLFLMKNRNSDAVSVSIDIDQKLHTFKLPTLALQIVVENCFKHNSMTSKNPLRITVVHTRDGYIQVVNNLQPKIGKVESTGNGLELLIKRYELMKIANGLIVDKTPEQFSVKLKLID